MPVYECPTCKNITFDLAEIQTNDHGLCLRMVSCHSCGREIGMFEGTAAESLWKIERELNNI
jgi:ribosomal protein S27E